MSRTIATRVVFLHAAAVALIVAAFVAVPGAQATKLYGCLGKRGSAHLYTKKPKRCRKGERRISWNSSGAPGQNGKNGANGTNGTNGAPGQPQKALAFK